MKHSLALLSTCGTSLLTHQADPETRRWLVQIANQKTLPEADRHQLDVYVAACRERLLSASSSERRRQSAEINSIAAVLERWPVEQIVHLLVHTDTAVGEATAGIAAAVLEQERQSVGLLTATGLRTDDFPAFRAGLAGLTQKLEEWAADQREQGRTVIFNLTGGFKSVNAYLQALGMLHADRCVFLFEGSTALMEIPRLPAKLADAEELRPHLDVFRRLSAGYVLPAEAGRGIPDSWLLSQDGRLYASVWGEVIWGHARKVLLADLPPTSTLSTRLVVLEAASQGLAELPSGQRIEINEALDALSAYLDQDVPLPSSHILEALEGNDTPPSTHRLRRVGLGHTWQLYGHFVRDCFIVDATRPLA